MLDMFSWESIETCSFALNPARKGSKLDLWSLPRALRFLSVAVKWDKASKNISCWSHWSHSAPAATVCSALPDEISLLEQGLHNGVVFMRNCFKSPVLPISPSWNIQNSKGKSGPGEVWKQHQQRLLKMSLHVHRARRGVFLISCLKRRQPWCWSFTR